MKKIIIYSIFCSFALANPNNLDILQKDKKEYRDLDKKSIETKYESLRNDWIGTLDFSSGLSRSHSFDKYDDRANESRYSKNAKIGFTQSIFESGGIEFKIDYAKDKLKYDLLSWENQNYQILYSIYNTLLEIKKLKLEMTQNDIRVVNKDIEQIIKKIQYDAGKVDIIELNNAIMSKNLILKEKISLENSLKEKEQELAKYTDLKYDEIEIMDFKEISKEDFLNKNLALMQEDAKIDMLNTDYKKKKTEYLPKVALSTNASYSNSDESFNRTIKDTNKDDASANVGLTLSMPLFDYNKTSKLEESKLEVLKQRAYLNDLKNETAYDYEQTLTKLDTYFKQNETIRKNIELYEELISANKISNESGMTSTYDLEILENTKLINDFDILLNDISIVQQYAKLYFKIKG